MDGMVAHDVYLRMGKGPIQQFRVWNGPLFIETRINEGLEHKDGPVLVSVHTEEEYKAQRVKRSKRNL